jgi:perosamine synthetase
MARLDIPRTVAALRAVAGGGDAFTPLHAPRFAGAEWTYLKDCLDTGWVSSVGSYVDRFERDLAALCGARRAVAVVNGTAALHVALLAAGVGRGDEVLIPALTFVATANATAYCGATPHFLDSEWATLGLDPDAMAARLAATAERRDGGPPVNRTTGRRIAAVVPMHAFGHPARIDAIAAVAQEWGLPVVEDAAESLGSLQDGRPLGARGLLGATSFNGNKIVTTGGGGAVLTDDEGLADRVKHLTTTAKRPHAWAFDHDETGFNYRLPNVNAALGCAQLEQLPDMLADKRRLAARYLAAFEDWPGARVIVEPPGAASNYWLNALALDDPADREPLLEAANAAGVMTRPVWTLMPDLPMHRGAPCAPLPVARDIAARLINVPSSAALGATRGAPAAGTAA